MLLLYSRMIIGVLCFSGRRHLLLIWMCTDRNTLLWVQNSKKKKKKFSSFKVGVHAVLNPTFSYWHQTSQQLFSLSINSLKVYWTDVTSSPPLSDCNRSIPKLVFYGHPVRDTWIFHLGLFVLRFCFFFFFFQGRGVFLEWTWVNVMILYTVEEITTAHCYLKSYIDNLKTSI